MKFYTRSIDAGQMVEIAYALDDPDVIIQRIHDRAAGTTRYYTADWTDDLIAWARSPESFAPPVAETDWIQITQEQYDRMMDDR
jgi:hypothetical protein